MYIPQIDLWSICIKKHSFLSVRSINIFSANVHFSTSWKQNKTFCFLMFSGGIKWNICWKWVKIMWYCEFGYAWKTLRVCMEDLLNIILDNRENDLKTPSPSYTNKEICLKKPKKTPSPLLISTILIINPARE